MKQKMAVPFLIVACLTTFISCSKDSTSNSLEGFSNKFDGVWALVAEYSDEVGWDYFYDSSDVLIEISGDKCTIYLSDLDGYTFKNGYLYCSKDDFIYDCSFTFTIQSNRAHFQQPNYWGGVTEMDIRNGKLYCFDSDTPIDNYCRMFERVNGFKGD